MIMLHYAAILPVGDMKYIIPNMQNMQNMQWNLGNRDTPYKTVALFMVS